MIKLLKKICYFLMDLAVFRKGIKVRINEFPIILPTRYYKYFPADYEQENFAFFAAHRKENMHILDVGAHFGLYSVFMQKSSNGCIYSFEPTPSTLAILKKTLSLNDVTDKVKVIPAAVADRSGKASFYIDQNPGSVSNSLVQYGNRPQSTTAYEVDMVSLDDFVKERALKIDFIKIDAEGVELSVLKGAEQLLTVHRPVMILALHPEAIVSRGETSKMIWDYLKAKNYLIIRGTKVLTEEEFIREHELFDVHLVPAESADKKHV